MAVNVCREFFYQPKELKGLKRRKKKYKKEAIGKYEENIKKKTMYDFVNDFNVV